MNDTADASQPKTTRRFQFSLGMLLLWITLAGLVVNSVLMSRRIEAMKREFDTQRPLSVAEVARQFEKRTTLGPVAVTVKDVRYSAESDSYKVDFSWVDASTNQTWFTDVKLKSDGYGSYYGQIRNGPFIKPLGYKEAFTVVVKSPSPLAK